MVEVYNKLERAGRKFERWFIIAIGNENNDGKVEVKGASKVVPAALKTLKRLLS